MSRVDPRNRDNAELATRVYLDGIDPISEAADWRSSVAWSRARVIEALEASDDLREIASALQISGKHMLVFRHILAPPKSQDQFSLLSRGWSKQSEKSGSPLQPGNASEVANVVVRWMDRDIAPWLENNRGPDPAERDRLLERVASFIAPKLTETASRNRLSNAQEGAVVNLLRGLGWTELPPQTLDTRAAVPPRCFMRKTKFATATTTAQEVDIACGLAGSYVLAMECKVTNDATNSVKRINDVLKKAAAWRAHWGSFVETAALLQGVIKSEDVQRLSDDGVRVFWSHDLAAFAEWLDKRC